MITKLNNNNRNNNYSYSYILSMILTKFDIHVENSDSRITQLSYGVFLFSLIGLVCFINILGYFIVYAFLKKGDFAKKYPRYTWLMNYYKGTTLIFLTIKILLVLFCLSCLLVFFSYYLSRY